MPGKKRQVDKIFGAYIPEGYRPASDYDRFCREIGYALCLWKPSNKPHSHAELSKTPQPQQWNKDVVNLCLGHIDFSLTRYWISEISSECGTEKDSNVKTVTPKIIQKNGVSHQNQQKGIPKSWVEMMDISNVFHDQHDNVHEDARYLHKCYGFKEFIVLAEHVNESVSYSKENMLLKLLEYVTLEYKCYLPLFIKCRNCIFNKTSYPWNYIGFLECPGFSTSFTSFETSINLLLCDTSLNDIAKLVERNVVYQKGWKPAHQCPINVSALIKYHINNKRLDHQCTNPLDINSTSDCWIEGCNSGRHRHFYEYVPTIKFHLYATWCNHVIYEFNDCNEDRDFDPLVACKWSIQATVTERTVIPDEDEVLMRFLSICSETQKKSLFSNPQLSSMLKYRRIHKQKEEVMQGSTEPKVRKVTSKLILKPGQSVIPIESLNTILDFLFCDTKLQPPHSNGDNASNTKTAEDELEEDFFYKYEEYSKYFKSTQLSSLTSRLALCLCIVIKKYVCLGGLAAVNQLWGEFVLEMKYCWEHNCEIKGLEPVESNVDYTELLQKLQILSSCIKKKKAREASSSNTDTSTNVDSSTDIFSEELSDISELPLSECIHNSEARVASTNGSLLSIQRLFNHLLAVRTFDAANPGFVIGDFVKWCFSEDCMEEMITDEGKADTTNEGIKNQRIKLTNDAWLVFRKGTQRRGPDDDNDNEAIKVFHWLASLKPSDLVFGLMPVLIHSAATTLLKHPLCQLGFIREHLTQIINALTSHNKEPQCTSSGIKEFKGLINNLVLVKDKMTTTRFLLNGLGYPNLPSDPGLEKFFSDVAEFREVQIETSQGGLPSKTHFGKLISKLFSGDQKATKNIRNCWKTNYYNRFLQPYFKEYHMVLDSSRTTGYCQRLCCIVQQDHLRMVAAFTPDVEPPKKITF